MIAITVSTVVVQLHEIYYHQDEFIVQPTLVCLMSIGLGAFQSNIVQFGLDQLQDASTTEIKSFIVWYVNSLITTGFIVPFNISCLNTKNKLYLLLLFQRCICCAKIKSLWKILIGTIVQIVHVTILMAFDVISRHYLQSEYNATIQCILYRLTTPLK
jgi:hypothetical protein